MKAICPVCKKIFEVETVIGVRQEFADGRNLEVLDLGKKGLVCRRCPDCAEEPQSKTKTLPPPTIYTT